MKTNRIPINTMKLKRLKPGLTQASYAVNGGEGHVRFADRLH
jgi:hypothetical protein